jgi:hypothetical protein
MFIRSFRVQIVETTAEDVSPWEPIQEDRPSSTRMRAAEPVSEFDDLRRWREGAVRSRRVG